MRFKIPGLRRAGVAAVAALTAGTAFATLTATPAFAVSVPTGTSAWGNPPPTVTGIAAASQPTIVAGTTNSAAGNWNIEVNAGTFSAGDFILVAVDDSDAAGAEPPGNCNSATDFVSFHAAPTVTVTSLVPANGVAQVTASLAATTGCVANTKTDILKITFTNGSSTFPQQLLTVSGVAYDSGTAVAGGAVVVTAVGCNSADTACGAPGTFTGSGSGTASNAKIALVTASANVPPKGLKPGTPSQAISNVVLTEAEAGAVLAGTVCLRIDSPSGGPGVGAFWDPASTPTVTATGGGIVNNGSGGANGTSSGVTINNTTTNPIDLFFTVNSATATAGTYTISGLKINSGTATGPVIIDVSNSSSCGNTQIADTLEVAAIVAVNRIGGADRYGTAAALFSGFAVTCTNTSGLNAVLARGDLFADALASSYLAGALFQGGEDGIQGSGILLTTPTTLPDVTLAALRQSGARDVFIVGGTSAVSQAIEDQLKATPAYACGGTNVIVGADGNTVFLKVTRIGGATRYDTAQQIGQFPTSNLIGTADVNGDAIPNPLRTAILARGDNFPDALAAGPMAFYGDNVSNVWDDTVAESAPRDAATSNSFGSGLGSRGDGGAAFKADGFPLFLTTPSGLSPQAQTGLLNDGIQQVIVMGGTAAIAASVDTQLQALGMSVIRLAGTDRSDTAVKAAALETGTYADPPPSPATQPRCDEDDTAPNGPFCAMPNGLFYRTDIINVARGDDAGGGADALSGGPFAAGLSVPNPNEGACCGGNAFFEGPSPILLTLDPNTLGASTAYLSAHSVAVTNSYYRGPTPNGGIVQATVFGQTAAITAATALAVQNALT